LKFDIKINGLRDRIEDVQKWITTKFFEQYGIIVQIKFADIQGYSLKVKDSYQNNTRDTTYSRIVEYENKITLKNVTLDQIALLLESKLMVPVVNESSTDKKYTFKIPSLLQTENLNNLSGIYLNQKKLHLECIYVTKK